MAATVFEVVVEMDPQTPLDSKPGVSMILKWPKRGSRGSQKNQLGAFLFVWGKGWGLRSAQDMLIREADATEIDVSNQKTSVEKIEIGACC